MPSSPRDSILPTPKGENIVIIMGARGFGVLLSDAVVDNGDCRSWRCRRPRCGVPQIHPPSVASGSPVDITGGEPPKTTRTRCGLGLEEPRIHALILGYWHTIVTPPMVSPAVGEDCRGNERKASTTESSSRWRATLRSKRRLNISSTTDSGLPHRPRSRWTRRASQMGASRRTAVTSNGTCHRFESAPTSHDCGFADQRVHHV